MDGSGDVQVALAARTKAQELNVLQAEVEAMVRHVVATQAEALKGTDLDPAAAKARRAKLIARAEELLPKEKAAPAAGDVATQLKNAMRANAFGDLRFSGRDPREVADELRSAWRDAGPLFDSDDQAQLAQFESVLSKVLPPKAAPAAVSVHDAITRPVAAVKPATIPPPVAAEAVDEGWDLGEDDPTGTPSAAEMASDGAPPDSLSED